MSEILEDSLSLCHLQALLSSSSASVSPASSSLASFLVLLNRLPASPLVEHLSHVRCSRWKGGETSYEMLNEWDTNECDDGSEADGISES